MQRKAEQFELMTHVLEEAGWVGRQLAYMPRHDANPKLRIRATHVDVAFRFGVLAFYALVLVIFYAIAPEAEVQSDFLQSKC